jgi:hypothetical protein
MYWTGRRPFINQQFKSIAEKKIQIDGALKKFVPKKHVWRWNESTEWLLRKENRQKCAWFSDKLLYLKFKISWNSTGEM